MNYDQFLSLVISIFNIGINERELTNAVNLIIFKNKEFKLEDYTSINLMQDKLGKPPFLLQRQKLGNKLFIRHDLFFSELRNAIIALELISHIFNRRLEEADALDFSFAVIWDLLDDDKRREFFQVWQDYDVLRTDPIFNLPQFVKTIGIPGMYARIKVPALLNAILNEGLDFRVQFNYTFHISSMKGLPPEDISLIVEVIKSNNRESVSDPKRVSELLDLHIIYQRKTFSPTRMGLENIICIFHVSRGEGVKIHSLPFENMKTNAVFEGSEDLCYVNFFIPRTQYANKSLDSWIKEMINSRDTPTNESIRIHEYPIIGIEDESLRVSFQRPKLFISGEWHLGEIAKPIPKRDKIRSVALSMKDRETVSELIRSRIDLTNQSEVESFETDLGLGTGEVKSLIEKKIVQQQYVIPFLHEFLYTLFIYEATDHKRKLFLEQIASRVPLSVNYFVDDKISKKRIGISFIGLPAHLSTKVRINFYKIDPKGEMVFQPTKMKNTPFISSEPTEKGWKFKKFPDITLDSNLAEL